MDEQLKSQLDQLIAQNRVTLFMKGTRHFPQCGFSATVVQILDELVPGYHTVNVLKEPAIRDGIKEYSSWPTIPQLYVDGKFVGGCDIVREMYIAGELQPLLGAKVPAAKPPQVTITAAARTALQAARTSKDGEGEGMLRLGVSSKFEYELVLDEPNKGDFQIDAGGGITVLVDRMSAPRADGITIDFAAGENGGGFRIDNPNEPGRVRTISVKELKARLERGEVQHFFDVRTEDERKKASIEGSKLLDAATAAEIEKLDKKTPLFFHCHHGGRSRNAAQRYAEQGFYEVYNVEGGIDAWSLEVDPKVPRY
jgi:monothiol glutaredoxin